MLPPPFGAAVPGEFIYKHLLHISGPKAASGKDYDLNTNSSLANPSVFEYVVPNGRTIDFSGCNFFITGWGKIHPKDLSGAPKRLAVNGSLFQIIDSDEMAVLLDFFDGVSLTSFDQFYKLGTEASGIITVGDDDLLPVRFPIQETGKNMRLTEGQRFRWTNRDNLSRLIRFQFMVHGAIASVG